MPQNEDVQHRSTPSGPAQPGPEPSGPAQPGPEASGRQKLWTPSPQRVRDSVLHRYQQWLAEEHNVRTSSYLELWDWSIEHLDQFWDSIWEFFEVRGDRGDGPVREGQMPGVRWCRGAQINYAENTLRHATAFGGDLGDQEALVGLHEDQGWRDSLTWDELAGQVGALAAQLRELGVGPGDRVCAVLPNIPQAVVALLATSSIGAVWSVVNTDFGITGIRDRFAQVEPTVLITVDSYQFNGTPRSQLGSLEGLLEALPTVKHHILVDQEEVTAQKYAAQEIPTGRLAGGSLLYSQIVAEPKIPEFTRVEFSEPLWILYSSGTTGRPKGIVHSHGGIVLEQFKSNGLQYDVRPGDRVYFSAATTWVMWNLMVESLSLGAAVITYDGAPTFGAADRQLEILARERATLYGTGAAVLAMIEKSGARPAEQHDFSALRTIVSSGSPLPDTVWDWVYEHISGDLRLGSDSGGTDISSGFIGSNPFDPVWKAELISPYLGVAADTYDDAGRPVTGEVGELVITEPMPSMPIMLWGDLDMTRYRETYFDTFEGVWRQGDWATQLSERHFIIHGRSDATINRGGIRMGSADICQIVDEVPGVQESMVIGAELPDGGYHMPLFVVPQDGVHLDCALRDAVILAIRRELSPRYVPDEIIAAPDVPRTRTGKLMEVPVKKVFQGKDPESIDGEVAINPQVLAWYLQKGVEFCRRRPS